MEGITRHDLTTGTIWSYDPPHVYCAKAPEGHGVGHCSKQCRTRIPSASTICKCDGDTGTFGRGIRYGERIASEGRSTEAVRDAAGERGTAAHAVLEALAAGRNPHLDSDYDYWAVAWWEDNEVNPLQVEQVIYSAEHNYAGRFDLFVERCGQTCLLDAKTSKGAYSSHAIQLNLYEIARREMGFDPAVSLAILLIGEDGYREVEVEYRPDWALHALASFRDGAEIRSYLRQAA